MTVSVIVPCLKRDEAAERCLAEIRRQAASGDAELDLVVVEGVSPSARARNEGLRRATGDYIAWVDADDAVRNGWWRSISEALAERPDVVVFGWHDEKSSADLAFCPSDSNPARQLLQDVLRDEVPCSFLWNKVIRKDLWLGVRFDERWFFQEDFAVLPLVLRKAQSVAVIAEPLYRYRFNPESISRKDTSDRAREIFDVRWHRFEDWQDSDLAADAILPYVGQVAWRYDCVVNGGIRLTDDGLLSDQLGRLRGRFLLVLRAHAGWRITTKIAFALLGWAWPQCLSLKLHGVLP